MVHRADCLRILHEKAITTGVNVRFQVSIATIHDSPDQPKVKLEDGTEYQTDLIIGADGQLFPRLVSFTSTLSPTPSLFFL